MNVINFYTDPYHSEIKGCDDDTDTFYSDMPKFSEESSKGLAVPLTLQELHRTLMSMETGKSTDTDGLPVEFLRLSGL